MAHGGIMRERFAQLLDNPCGSGRSSRPKMENAPLGVIDREPDIEDSEGAVGTVKKSIAAIASRWLRRNCITLERTGVWPAGEGDTLKPTFRDGETQHAELTVNARSAQVDSHQPAQDQFA